VGDIETTTVEIIVTVTDAALEGSASGVAVICTVAGAGGNAGAVYTPLEEIVPHAAPVHPVPETLHEIARLGFELATGLSVAVKLAAEPAFTEAGPVSVSANELVMVIVPVPLFDGSAMLVAVRETLGGAARIWGAVYIPDKSTAPQAVPAHPFPETLQRTARLGLPAEFTVATNGCAAPSATGIACGETLSEISLVMFTDAEALFVVSATLMACTVTKVDAGRLADEV
jgi:hypothetical protein